MKDRQQMDLATPAFWQAESRTGAKACSGWQMRRPQVMGRNQSRVSAPSETAASLTMMMSGTPRRECFGILRNVQPSLPLSTAGDVFWRQKKTLR
jgi:hypothetical protein